MLRLGLNLPYSAGQMAGATPRWSDILAMAQAAEAVGFDSVWVSDHVGFGDPDGEWSGAWESWTLLSAIAASTARVRLGTYVTCTPFRNPALLAKMAETLDEVSGGRLILGLGAGWNEPEFRAYGFPFEDRFDRFEDSLRIICSMLRTGTAHHDGTAAQARGARLEPRGPRPGGLPVMVGAGGPRMLRLTADRTKQRNCCVPWTMRAERSGGIRQR
jgi:alkanesulfonate monooxygenase SsuD/methylene tetrahydromethanopterin reductase-like flavin-dependent oxidoreductase (luciferase family)